MQGERIRTPDNNAPRRISCQRLKSHRKKQLKLGFCISKSFSCKDSIDECYMLGEILSFYFYISDNYNTIPKNQRRIANTKWIITKIMVR
jgi:hypothetical protein